MAKVHQFMAKIELKKPVVDEISANLEGAAGVVLVDHCGLTVEQDTQLRKQMREEGIVYKVYKNTMLNFAIKGTEFEPLSQHLEGSLSPKLMRLLRQESLLTLQRKQRNLRLKLVL